jgi:hypothetical protein
MHGMFLTTKAFKNVYSIFRVHQLESSNKVKSSVLSLIFSELFGVKVTDIVKTEFLHIDALKRLLYLHDCLRGLVRYNDYHSLEDGIILVERTVGTSRLPITYK